MMTSLDYRQLFHSTDYATNARTSPAPWLGRHIRSCPSNGFDARSVPLPSWFREAGLAEVSFGFGFGWWAGSPLPTLSKKTHPERALQHVHDAVEQHFPDWRRRVDASQLD